jgi:hypothetical protein
MRLCSDIPLSIKKYDYLDPNRPVITPPNITPIAENITNKIIRAGIEAITHLTMKTTIDKKDICISVTTTSCGVPLPDTTIDPLALEVLLVGPEDSEALTNQLAPTFRPT